MMIEESLRVLVLEDDENLRELLVETLEDEGYQSEGAANGVEAIEKVSRQSFDLLVVDVRMEGMSGLEAFSYMRQQGAELACLVITGYATEEDSIRAIRLGVGDYLRKPFEIRDLLLRLARVAAVFQRQREGRQREQRLQTHLHWLSQQQGDAPARQAGQLAAWIGQGLQLDSVVQLELALAANLAQQGLNPVGSSHHVAEALQSWQENWDGSGPGGLSEENIPLSGRIVRLAVVAASAEDSRPERLSGQFSGKIDPYLLSALELGRAQQQGAGSHRLLDLARGLISSGQGAEAALALQQAESSLQGPEQGEVQLLLAGLEPAPLQRQRLERLVQNARGWGGSHEGHFLLEAGLLMMGSQPDRGAIYLREACSRLGGSAQEASRSLALLGLWVAGQAPPDWSPVEALQPLLTVANEPRLYRCLPWLGAPLLGWELRSDSDGAAVAVLTRFIRKFAGALTPLLSKVATAQRVAWVQRLQSQPQGVPPSWLSQLNQDNDAPIRNIIAQAPVQPRSQEKPPALHIRSFGTFTVYVEGCPVSDKAYRGSRNKMLLAYIASSARVQPEERVRDVFWPDDMEKARKGLYNSIFNLRKALKPAGWPGDCDYFVRQQEWLGLDPDLEPWHDLWEVEQSFQRMRRADFAGLQVEMARIMELVVGPYLDGCYMDWAVERREQLDIQLVETLQAACQRAIEASAWERLAEWSQRLLVIDPCHQKGAAYRMRGLCHLGRPEEALRLFDSVSRRLRTEYEMEPSTEMIEWATRAKLAV